MKITLHTLFFCFTACLIFVVPDALAQNLTVSSQVWLNPFQFNPAYTAQNGHAEANIFYRQQWLGIENAPVSGSFNIQAPFGRNVSLGFAVNSSKTILLNSTNVIGAFAYRVRLGYYHHLNFGLAGGIGLNNFDLDAVANTFDPALANISQRSTYMMGQFGVNYQHKKLNIGISLPKLFDSNPTNTETPTTPKHNPFASKFVSASYSFNLGEIQLAPGVLYRALDDQQKQWEAMAIATYRSFLWAGLSYRDGYGIIGMVGVRLKGILRFGYAYEHPTGSISKASSGVHEIYAGLKFGKRDRELEYFTQKKKEDSLAQVAELLKLQEQIAKKTIPKDTVASQAQVKTTDSTKVAEPIKPEEKVVAQPKKEGQTLTGYYVVVGAFRSQTNAMKDIMQLGERGLYPEMIYLLEKNYYYVYTVHTPKKEHAIEELRKIRGKYPRAWIFSPSPK